MTKITTFNSADTCSLMSGKAYLQYCIKLLGTKNPTREFTVEAYSAPSVPSHPLAATTISMEAWPLGPPFSFIPCWSQNSLLMYSDETRTKKGNIGLSASLTVVFLRSQETSSCLNSPEPAGFHSLAYKKIPVFSRYTPIAKIIFRRLPLRSGCLIHNGI